MKYPNAEQVERVLQSIHGPSQFSNIVTQTGLTKFQTHAALRILSYRGAVVQVKGDRWVLRRSEI